MDPRIAYQRHVTRREFLGRSALGIGTAALSTLLSQDLAFAGDAQPARFGGLDSLPHYAPKAKRVIYLLHNGAPPHVDMYDYKPGMKKLFGTILPESVHRNQRLSTMTAGQKEKLVLPSITTFRRYGESGTWVSDWLPHIGSIADDVCFVKSMHTTQVNNAPAITFFLTGAEMPGRSSIGAWLTYGLGSETQELPGFVVMT